MAKKKPSKEAPSKEELSKEDFARQIGEIMINLPYMAMQSRHDSIKALVYYINPKETSTPEAW